MLTPIYVIGSSNTDMVVKAERLPRPGETIIGGTFFMNPGGKGANQAVAAARLGGQVTFMGNVGNDLFGQQTIRQLKSEGINTDFIQTDDQYPSGVALINVDGSGENCIVVAPGANGQLVPSRIESFVQRLTAPAFALVQLEIPVDSVAYIMEQCARKSIPVILNPAPAARIGESLFKYIFVITPNESETEILTGITVSDHGSVRKAGRHLHNHGVRNVVITLGKRGAYWSDGITDGLVPAPEVVATDTTAAGDCFNGALAVALSEGMALPDAAHFACRAASVSVTRMGAQASMPTRAEVDLIIPTQS